MSGIFSAGSLQKVFPMLPDGLHWHLLRSFYLAFVHHCYTHTKALSRLAECILGHQEVEESLAYVSVVLESVDELKGAFGELVL